MRIVQVITRPQRRGAEIFATQLSEQLLRKGHEVILISLFTSSQELSFSGQLIRLDLPSRGKLDFGGFWHLAQELKRLKPDIVQANASETLRMCVFSRVFYSGSYCLIYRNANQMSGLLKGILHKLWNQSLLSKVDGIVSVSEASKRDLKQTFSVKMPLEVIPIGIDPEQITESLKQGRVNITEPYLIQIGGLVAEKDPLGMLSLFSKIKNQDLHLVFLGSGPLEGALQESITKLNLEKRVKLIPNQANIFPYLDRAKALVMPSKVEGLPGVILEAIYCRVPVIAYGVGGIPEVLQHGKTGWCIPPADQEAFVEAMEQVLSLDDQARKELVENAFQLVKDNYTLDRVALEFEKFYKRILE